MNPHHNTSSIGDVVTGAAGWTFALGVLTMMFFPFALPGIVLTAAAVVPLALAAVVVGLVAALVAAPAMAVRGLRRRARSSITAREVPE